jgi:quinolinate synthase
MLRQKVDELKRKVNAVIVAHNYQLPEVQDVADFVGDSLELARKVVDVDAGTIVFAGVDFMAETAAILNPDKTVLIPSRKATCELATYLTDKIVKRYQKRHMNARTVVYVNSTAEVKATADVVCTSSNAVRIVEAMDSDEVLFGPDANLARYVGKNTEKTVIPLPGKGHCYVHTYFDADRILNLKRKHGGEIMAHPECEEAVQEVADVIASTGGMIRHVAESKAKKFIVVTERDMSYRLQKLYPDREFIPAWDDAICLGMKQIDLQAVYNSLKNKKYVVKVDEKVAVKARKAIERMLELS